MDGHASSTGPAISTLGDAARFLVRHFRLVLGLSMTAGVLTAVLTILLVPKKYEGTATLVLISPKISSDLKPATLTIQGYQRLLESDAIIEETRRKLIEKGILTGESQFRMRDDLETRIFVSKFSETTTLAPMIQAVVRGRTPESAASCANIWAEVFLHRVHELMAGSTSTQVQFVDEQYPKSQERLKKSENERMSSAADFHRRLNELTKMWDEKILRMKNETTDMLTLHEAQTKTVINEFQAAHGMETRRSQLDAIRRSLVDLQLEETQINAQVQKNKLQLETARKTLAESSPFVTVRKAITDEALWRALVASEGKEPDWKQLQEKSLATQELNPIYQELASRVHRLELDEKSIGPRTKLLEDELVRIASSIKVGDVALRAEEAKLNQLSQERESGYEKLRDKRKNDLADLMNEKQRYIAALTMERDLHLAQLDRGIAQERELNTELAKNFNQALLAKAQQSVEDMRLGAPAVPVDRALARGVVLGAGVAAALGTLLATLIAWYRETHRPVVPASR